MTAESTLNFDRIAHGQRAFNEAFRYRLSGDHVKAHFKYLVAESYAIFMPIEWSILAKAEQLRIAYLNPDSKVAKNPEELKGEILALLSFEKNMESLTVNLPPQIYTIYSILGGFEYSKANHEEAYSYFRQRDIFHEQVMKRFAKRIEQNVKDPSTYADTIIEIGNLFFVYAHEPQKNLVKYKNRSDNQIQLVNHMGIISTARMPSILHRNGHAPLYLNPFPNPDFALQSYYWYNHAYTFSMNPINHSDENQLILQSQRALRHIEELRQTSGLIVSNETPLSV